jgi:hypothetical protein
VYTCERLVDWRAAFAGKPAPTGFGVHLQEIGRLAGCLRWQASSHRVWCTPARDWSAGRLPSLAGQLPQGLVYICKKLVGWQAAFAGKPAPTGFGVHLQEIGRLAGRLRWQASSHRVWCTSARNWSAGRPPSLASQLPQLERVHLRKIGRLAGRHRRQASSHNKNRSTPPALHHSTGRAVARLQLLILIWLLIYPPLRQAEWRRLSGGQARSAVRRSRTHREEVVAKQTGGDAPR